MRRQPIPHEELQALYPDLERRDLVIVGEFYELLAAWLLRVYERVSYDEDSLHEFLALTEKEKPPTISGKVESDTQTPKTSQ